MNVNVLPSKKYKNKKLGDQSKLNTLIDWEH